MALAASLLVRIALGASVAFAAVALLQTSVAPQVTAPATNARVTSSGPAATGPAAPAPAQPARPAPAVFAMTMNDADLTKAAAGGFPQTVSGVTVSDPDVHVESTGVRLTATAKILFGTTQFVMTATPTVADGKIAVRVDSTLAGMRLPDSTRASITDTVQSTISRLIPANVRVTSVTFASGRLSVLGTQP